ncbi:hypothetical protein [Pelagerythrobacter sp.]|uniref:hypothetical protein n=1 Tax=Pelagerythrobacter sp. TaxID=2800702 RepID=UPI0035B260D7
MSGGLTLGSILSDALRKADQSNPHASPIVAAAFGDRDSLRVLANAAYVDAEASSGVTRLISLVEALTFIRLAAAQGQTPDRRQAVYLYDAIAADLTRNGLADAGVPFAARALALSELMAIDGDEQMAAIVASHAEELPAEVHAQARELVEWSRTQ